MQRSLIRAGVAGISTALLLAACGGPGTGSDNGIKGETVAQIQSQVKAAIIKNKSFEASGPATLSGQKGNLDLKVDIPNKAASMLITFGSGGGKVSVVMVGGHAFMTFDKAAAQMFMGSSGAPASLVDQIADKCIDFGASDSSNNPLGSSGALDFTSGDPFGSATDWKKGNPKTVNGQEVLPLSSESDKTELDIYTHGDPLPASLIATGTGSETSGNFAVSQWGSSFSISKPSGCVSLEQLLGGLTPGGSPTDTPSDAPTDTPSDTPSDMPTDTPSN